MIGGEDVAPFLVQEADLFLEDLSLLALRSHKLLKLLDFLVSNPPLILKLSTLNTDQQTLSGVLT